MLRVMLRGILLAGCVLGVYTTSSAQLVINELMQSNIDCIKDDLNEFPDSWVELYNAGDQNVHLNYYKIGDSEKVKKAYQLPSMTVTPGAYVLVYCDKVGEGLHTDFRLDSGKGGSVYLFRDNEIVDKVEEWKKQPAPNIAYGRETDNGGKWGYQAVPTPGKENCGKLYKEILGEPIFSEPGKVMTDKVMLELSLPDDAPEGTIIRYTLDGKEPVETSQIYNAPINVGVSTVVRAKLFCEGYLSPRSTTHSYLRHPREMSLPVVSIVSDNRYFYDDKEGILVKGSYTSWKPNYEYDWRRPINIEYFDAKDCESAFNQLCEARVKGGATRGNALKSLAVYANKRFGTKRFNYEFFPDQTPGIDEFKSFEMRNSGNDFDYMYMRDAVIQQSMGMNADLDWQPSRPVILYINGQYKGLLNIRPRSNEDHIYSYYDGLEDIDMFENWWELKEGDWDNYNDFQDFYKVTGHSFEEYEKWMDTSEFCNLMVMGIFFDNKDFPGNNIVMWRPKTEDGRWRWIAKDTDFGMGLYGERPDYPTLNWITTQGYDNNRNDWANKKEHTAIFRHLLDTPEFKDMFIDRCAVYMGDFLTVDAIIARIDKRYNELKGEYKSHRDLINPWWPTYSQEIDWGKTWTRQRWDFFYKHLADFFQLSAPVKLTVAKGECENRELSINGIALKGTEFKGKYYPGRKLVMESNGDDGLYTNGWEVKVSGNQGVTIQNYEGERLAIAMPEGQSVEITPLFGTEPAAVGMVSADIDDSMDCELYDLSGRNIGDVKVSALPQLSPGIYILRQGSASRKVMVGR